MQRRASAAKGTGCHVCGGGFAAMPQRVASAAASLVGGRFGSRFTVLAACDQVWQAPCDFARREFWMPVTAGFRKVYRPGNVRFAYQQTARSALTETYIGPIETTER